MIEPATIVPEEADLRRLCWICHNALKSDRPPKTATGLCQRCYSREYQRSIRTGKPMIRTPDDALASGRPDLQACLLDLPKTPAVPPTRRERHVADRAAAAGATAAPPVKVSGAAAQAEIDRLTLRVQQLRVVAEAARAWYRAPFLAGSSARLKAAVEGLNRADGAKVSRIVPID